MSTKTTNFNLTKPELTDAADITSTNTNWDIVDEVIPKKVDLLADSVGGVIQHSVLDFDYFIGEIVSGDDEITIIFNHVGRDNNTLEVFAHSYWQERGLNSSIISYQVGLYMHWGDGGYMCQCTKTQGNTVQPVTLNKLYGIKL